MNKKIIDNLTKKIFFLFIATVNKNKIAPKGENTKGSTLLIKYIY